jgi:putative phage-type endonuclease
MEDQIKFLIETYGNDDQRTDAWFTKRNKMLTASEIWKCFGDASKSARKELIISKLAPPKKQEGGGVGALIWGTRFEHVAKEIYCHTEGVTLKDLACVTHPDYNYVGASPDGLILTNDERNGRLIELKCPISRIFDDSTSVPDHYYHQMQLQMECTKLHECDYVEMQFKTMNYSEWVETSAEFKSVFVVHGSNVSYKSIHDTQPLQDWMANFPIMECSFVYWILKAKSQKLIKRDPDWWSTHFPEIKATWEEILDHQLKGTLPASSVSILEL